MRSLGLENKYLQTSKEHYHDKNAKKYFNNLILIKKRSFGTAANHYLVREEFAGIIAVLQYLI